MCISKFKKKNNENIIIIRCPMVIIFKKDKKKTGFKTLHLTLHLRAPVQIAGRTIKEKSNTHIPVYK